VSGRPAIPATPVVGTEVTDCRQLAHLDGLAGVDVRIRVADGLRLPRQPADRLVYRASDVEPLEFLGQLDFYVDTGSAQRPVLDATTMGCLVLPPGEVLDGVRRYRRDPALAAERRRQDQLALRADFHPGRFADRIAALARNAS
jgi:hypothetical protein